MFPPRSRRDRVITLRVAEAAPEGERAELICLLQPVLATERDYVNQPSYCGLGILLRCATGPYWSDAARGGKPASYLCVACDREVSFSCDGQVFPGRGGLGRNRREPRLAVGGADMSSHAADAAGGLAVRLRIALCLGVGEEESCGARTRSGGARGTGALSDGGCAGILGMGAPRWRPPWT